jgi:hypothetical protein
MFVLTTTTFQTSELPYVMSLAGVACDRKVSKRNPTPFSVFCGAKLRELNSGKPSILSLKCVLTDRFPF